MTSGINEISYLFIGLTKKLRTWCHVFRSKIWLQTNDKQFPIKSNVVWQLFRYFRKRNIN